jgi:hypothetical protein
MPYRPPHGHPVEAPMDLIYLAALATLAGATLALARAVDHLRHRSRS